MRGNRRPAPHQRPKTAAELVLDLEARASRGAGDEDFEVPAEEWALLVQLAKREQDRPRAAEHG